MSATDSPAANDSKMSDKEMRVPHPQAAAQMLGVSHNLLVHGSGGVSAALPHRWPATFNHTLMWT